MAFTPEQENALLALLDEPLVTLNELPKAANIEDEDLFLTRKDTTERAVTGNVMKDYFASPATLEKRGTVQLTNDANSDNEEKAVTPKGVKIVNDNANNRVLKAGDKMTGSLAMTDSLIIFSNPELERSHLFFKKEDGSDLEYAAIIADSTGLLTIRTGYSPGLKSTQTTIDKNGNFNICGNSNIHPVGAPIPWPTITPPSGWVICNGAAFNKAIYPELAKVYPSGSLPDLRGEFIRGMDAGRGVDPNRVILSQQGDAIRNITGKLSMPGARVSSNGVFGDAYGGSWSGDNLHWNATETIDFDTSRVVPTAAENRPRNVAFLYIVRAA